jgi:CheY-like chemotaxis protein
VSERPCKVLILDHDPDVLTSLQHVLEDAGVDTTITWDGGEAWELTQNTLFDLILVGDHPPELVAETFLHGVGLKAAPCRCLLLGASEPNAKRFRRFGITGVVPKRDPFRVLEEVQKHWHSQELAAKQKSTTAA